MTKRNRELEEELSPLMKQTVVAEASEKVWAHFERAMESLDPESAELLSSFFQGKSVTRLAQERNLSADEIERWIGAKKKELVQRLRTSKQIRQ